VLLNSKLPKEPKLFTLAHELKHHYLDREQIEKGEIRCGNYNAHELIEKAAEVFAAEFIYPQAEMLELISAMDITSRTCTVEKVIELKRTCPVSVSYAFVLKRLEWFHLCARDASEMDALLGHHYRNTDLAHYQLSPTNYPRR